MQLKVKYLFPETEELRTRAGDSGYDLRAAIKEPLVIDPHGRTTVGTGIAVEVATEMNIDLELQVRPRSGHTVKGIVAQFGTIDASYRGEIQITLFNFSSQPVTIEPNERIAQLVVCPIFKPEIITAKELTPTERGTHSQEFRNVESRQRVLKLFTTYCIARSTKTKEKTDGDNIKL